MILQLLNEVSPDWWDGLTELGVDSSGGFVAEFPHVTCKIDDVDHIRLIGADGSEHVSERIKADEGANAAAGDDVAAWLAEWK